MASQKFEKGSMEWQMWRDMWELSQKFYVPEPDNDEYHEAVLRDVNQFTEKYNTSWGKAFGRAIFWAIHDIEESMLEKERAV